MDYNLKSVIATRRHYLLAMSRMVQELSNPDKILEKIQDKTSAYENLKYDAHVSSCIQSRKSGTLSLEWEINRGGTKTAEVHFIEEIFKQLPMMDIFSEILDAPYFGYRFLEIYYQAKEGKIVPVAIVGKPNEWFFFDQNNLPRFRDIANPKGIPIPKRKFFVVQHNPSYNNPYGEALLAKCYWPVFYKKEVVKFWATFCEKFGIPYLWGEVPEGSAPEDAEELRDELDDMRQDGVIVTEGEGKKVSILDVSKSGSPDLFKEFISFFNAEISKTILSQTLTTELPNGKGSYAASKSHAEIRQDIIDADKRLVEQCINDLIKWLIDYNFPGVVDYPKFEFYAEEDVDLNLANRDRILAEMKQFKFTREYFQRTYGFKDDEFDVNNEVINTYIPLFADTVKNQLRFTKAYWQRKYLLQDDEFEVVEASQQQAVPGGFAEDENLSPEDEGLEKVKQLGTDDFGKAFDLVIDKVLELINAENTYDEIQNKLAGLLPELDTSAIDDLIARGIMVANAGGQIKAAL